MKTGFRSVYRYKTLFKRSLFGGKIQIWIKKRGYNKTMGKKIEKCLATGEIGEIQGFRIYDK